MAHKVQLPDLLPPDGRWPVNWSLKGRGVNSNPPDRYLRISSGRYRNWYEHRAVADLMLRLNQISKGVVGVPEELPKAWEIHHLDGDRHHNCPYNLLISPSELHPRPNGTSREQARHPYTGRFLSRDEAERLMDQGLIRDDRVPF